VSDASYTYNYTGTLSDGNSTAYDSATKPTLPGSYTVTATLDSTTHAGSGSAAFTISRKDLSWIAGTANDRIYNGGIGATVGTEPTLSGIITGDVANVGNGAAYFASPNAGTGIAVTGTGYSVTGTDAWKYNAVGQPGFGTADITAKAVTITPDAGQNKKYGETDPVFTFADPGLGGTYGLYGSDAFSGALSYTGADVGNYAFTLGTLSAGSNYSLTLGGSVTFEITKADSPAAPTVTGSYTGDGT
jgi:hypothetical protein